MCISYISLHSVLAHSTHTLWAYRYEIGACIWQTTIVTYKAYLSGTYKVNVYAHMCPICSQWQQPCDQEHYTLDESNATTVTTHD